MPQIPQITERQVEPAAVRLPFQQQTSNQGEKAFAQGLQNFATAQERLQANRSSQQATSLVIDAVRQIEEFDIGLTTDRDYETQVDRYDQLVGGISENVGKNADPMTARFFEQEFVSLANKKRFEIQRGSLKGQIGVQRAITQDNLTSLAELGGTGDEEFDGYLKLKGLTELAEAFKNGLYEPEEVQKLGERFESDMEVASVRRAILLDPEQAERMLLSDGFTDLSGDARTIWTERAQSAADRVRRERVSAEDRAYRLAEREEADREEDTHREGLTLANDGNMTAEWIEDNRDTLSPSALSYFYGVSRGEENITDLPTYTALMERAGNGEDIVTDARNALYGGRIKREDYDRVLGIFRSEGQKGWYRRGQSFIERSLKPSDLNPDPGAPQRYAAAMDDWYQWTVENPQADTGKASQAFRQIVSEYAIIGFEDFSILARAPRFAVGSRNDMDINATKIATIEALEAGAIGEQEAARQALLIQQWQNFMDKKRAQTGESGNVNP